MLAVDAVHQVSRLGEAGAGGQRDLEEGKEQVLAPALLHIGLDDTHPSIYLFIYISLYFLLCISMFNVITYVYMHLHRLLYLK